MDSNEEIDKDVEYLTLEDGSIIKIGAIDIDDVVFDNLEDNITEYGSLQERDEARGEYPYFEDYIGGYGLDNAKIWTVNEMPPFTPVNLRTNPKQKRI